MRSETIEHLRTKLEENPLLRANAIPTREEIDQASLALGIPFAHDYREFLLMFGGAMLGPYPIFGLRPVEVMDDDYWSVVDVTKKFRNEKVPGTEEWVVISEDHSGNPVGLDVNGKVWIHDHDFGGVSELTPGFEDYIREYCLKVEP